MNNMDYLPIEDTVTYLLKALRLSKDPGNLLLDSPGLTKNINLYLSGYLKFDDMILIYEDLLDRKYISPVTIINVHLFCGWNLFSLVPKKTEQDFIMQIELNKMG